MICDKNDKSPSHSCAMGFFATSQSASQTAPLIGEPMRKEIFQHKNRQRRGKEEKAALPVYENS